jgi:succinate dehydrogenase / fumarate reductase cytochrome b subunit
MISAIRGLGSVRSRKMIEASTGMLLLVFCVEHVLGNSMLLLSDPEPYRWYTETMGRALLIRIAEVVLFGLFAVHISTGLYMRWQHMRFTRSHPEKRPKQTLSTRLVGWTGAAILIFLVIHLDRFFLPNRFAAEGTRPDLYLLAHEAFASPWYTTFYVACMVALASHLHHGIRSAFFSFKFIPPHAVPRVRSAVARVGLITPLLLGYIALHICVAQLLGR